MTDIKLELGGGDKPREGFLNVDCRRDRGRVDIEFDLERCGWECLGEWCPGKQLPVPDGSVSEVYSAHCLEHVQNLSGVLWELARVCRHGARIEIHVPHWLNPDAMCPGHRHVITENVVKGWCREERCGKRFELASVWHLAGALFEEAKELHPTWKDEQVLKFVPGAAFETQFVLRVVQGG